MGRPMALITPDDFRNISGSGRVTCGMCNIKVDPDIDGAQHVKACFMGSCRGKYTICKDCGCITNQERRMHTVQGLLHMHATSAAMREQYFSRAANAMPADTTQLADSPQSGEEAGAILRPTVTDGSGSERPGAAMLMIIDDA